ncbi:MAG: DNA pilot protein [Microviridae sp.]|nr:MAG: DNA pilot protein [Microviridae sp.]
MGLFSGIGSFFGPVGSILGGIGDELLGRDDAQQQNQTSVANTRLLRQTAYQDTTQDLKAAGLNPMLAYSNGATSATSPPVANKGLAAAQQNSAQSSIANVNADTVNKQAQTDQIKAQTELIRAQTGNTTTSTANIDQQTKNLQTTMDKTREEIQLVMKQTWNETERGNLMSAQRQLAEIDSKLRASQITNTEAETAYKRVLSTLTGTQIEGAKNQEAFEKSLAGDASPYMRALGTILNSAKKVTQ